MPCHCFIPCLDIKIINLYRLKHKVPNLNFSKICVNLFHFISNNSSLRNLNSHHTEFISIPSTHYVLCELSFLLSFSCCITCMEEANLPSFYPDFLDAPFFSIIACKLINYFLSPSFYCTTSMSTVANSNWRMLLRLSPLPAISLKALSSTGILAAF